MSVGALFEFLQGGYRRALILQGGTGYLRYTRQRLCWVWRRGSAQQRSGVVSAFTLMALVLSVLLVPWYRWAFDRHFSTAPLACLKFIGYHSGHEDTIYNSCPSRNNISNVCGVLFHTTVATKALGRETSVAQRRQGVALPVFRTNRQPLTGGRSCCRWFKSTPTSMLLRKGTSGNSVLHKEAGRGEKSCVSTSSTG